MSKIIFNPINRKQIKKVLYFLIIYTILIKKYIEENLNTINSNKFETSPEDHLWIDIEQSLFNVINNLLTRSYSSQLVYSSIFFHCAQLLFHLLTQTKEFDNYINLEKFIQKTKKCFDVLSNNSEKTIFQTTLIKVYSVIFEKSNNPLLKKESHNFLINLTFSSILDNSQEFIVKNSQNLKSILKNNKIYAYTTDAKNELLFSEDIMIKTLINDKKFLELKDSLDSFFNYMWRFTSDVTAGKKIWDEVEKYLLSNSTLSNNELFIEIIIIYIFNKNKLKIVEEIREKSNINLNINNPPKKSGINARIILSSIFEFLSDKLNSDSNCIQKTSNTKYLNLFYEIICKHFESILIDNILNERYMFYLAHLFIEDMIFEEENDILISRFYEILSRTTEPYKLVISLISNIGKFITTKRNNIDKIYSKLIRLLCKFCEENDNEKGKLDLDELFNIVQNFSTDVKNLRTIYIMFFIKFILFSEYHFKLEFNLVHRKKLFVIIFEMFYELIVNCFSYENRQFTIDAFLMLLELIIIIVNKYSYSNVEDGYFIYKMTSIVCKKILQDRGVGESMKETNQINFETSAADNINKTQVKLMKTQILLIYGLVSFIVYIITEYLQLSQVNVTLLHESVINGLSVSDNDIYIKTLLNTMFKLINLSNLSSTITEFSKLLNATTGSIPDNSNSLQLHYESSGTFFLELVLGSYFSQNSVINKSIEHKMPARQLQNYAKEFNSTGMTFRDFTKVQRRDTENISENDFSVLSSREIDGINDITIQFTDELKSDRHRETLTGFINVGNIISGTNLCSDVSPTNNINMYRSEMDDFLTNNQINTIKL